jgi:hypothetical protein
MKPYTWPRCRKLGETAFRLGQKLSFGVGQRRIVSKFALVLRRVGRIPFLMATNIRTK